MAEAVPVCICVHDDHYFLAETIRSWKAAGPVYVFVSQSAWNGEPGDWERSARVAESEGAMVVVGDWPDEDLHRQAAHWELRNLGFDQAFTPDGDEIVEPQLFESLINLAQARAAERIYVHMDTYWKSADFVIRPPEALAPIILVDLAKTEHVHIRDFVGGRALVLGPEHGVLHHLSYAGPDERIEKKIRSWGHRNEVIEGWYERVWKRWDADKLMRNLHPTHPHAYGFAEHIDPPEILKGLRPVPVTLNLNGHPHLNSLPKVSVVIPLHGGSEDIRQCLSSLEKCIDLLHEVFVVDNGSPDNAAQVAQGFGFVELIRNETNEGFAKASNQGLAASSGEVVLFLNSDTVVPRAGLEALLVALMASGSIGAAGPLTNECGHSQRVDPTYTSLDNLDRFAQDFAARDADDYNAPADMLVGFCLAVRKSVLNEVGGFDETFGLGTFEDNDLCFRIRRAGYRLVIAAKSFVHHHGSRTLRRVSKSPWTLLQQNEQRFQKKWREDLESGFASHLPGAKNTPIVFDQNKHPSRRLANAKENARLADISLCMIVKNEERVLSDCLKSALPFFTQIVVVDTGSTDRTKEIASELGAEVYEFPWTDSFSEARNHSLTHARGKWVFWMDADDTLPFWAGEELLRNVLEAQAGVTAFVVPVQFIDEGNGAGTRVDHVKLFRNHPTVKFEGRIHEQNLGSLREIGGDIVRSNAVVMHSGYDTSDEGQARKRARDEKLLKLDLDERPNHPFVLFNLGMTAHFCGDHGAAIAWLQKSIDASQPGESHLRKAYALKAASEKSEGQTGVALSTVMRGLSEVPDDPELLFHAGLLLTDMNRLPEAKQMYEKISENIAGHFSSIDMAILTFKRFHNLGSVCWIMGDYKAAKDWWLRALDSAPTFLPSARDLFDCALQMLDYSTARDVLDHVRKALGPCEDWAAMGARYSQVLGGSQEAEGFLRRAASQHPYALGPRLILSRHLLQSGRELEAQEHLEVLERCGSAEAAFYLGVSATRRGNLADAFRWMERAHQLNPYHEDTKKQLASLERALAPAPSA